MKPDHARCERIATELLIASNINQFPIPIRDLNFQKNIVFDSMQNYCKLTGLHISELTRGKHFKDGFNLVMKEMFIILYNEGVITKERISWTLGHEVGHALLGHTKDDDISEVETNQFTAHLFMPDPIIVELIRRNVRITTPFLVKIFGVSPPAAGKKIDDIRKHPWKLKESYQFEFNDIILSKFQKFVDMIAPPFDDLIYEENDLYDRLGNNSANPFLRRHQ